MALNEISAAIIDHSIQIHSALGPGLFESIFQRVLAYELRKAGFKVDTEVAIPLVWDGVVINDGFRADIIVNKSVLVELKSVESIQKVHHKQILTYLKLTDLRLGLLLNFGAPLLKDGIHRVVNGLPE